MSSAGAQSGREAAGASSEVEVSDETTLELGELAQLCEG